MPIIKSAIKKMRQDAKRRKNNLKLLNHAKAMVKKMRKNPSKKSLIEAYKALDKAVKDRVIHKNRAARVKSRLSHLLSK